MPAQGCRHGTRNTMLLLLGCYLTLTTTGCNHKTAEADSTVAAPLPVLNVAMARIGAVERTLPVTATVAPLPNQEASISPTVSGILDGLPVRLGQEVGRNEMVAHLSTASLVGQIAQARATIAQNEIQVKQAQVGEIQQHAQGQAAVEQAASAVANARATLASVKATLAGDEAALHNAQEKLDREKALFKDGLVAQKDVEDAVLTVSTARATVDAQQQTVNAQQQTVNGQIHALQAAKTVGLQDTIKRADVDIARAQVSSAQGALRTAESQMSMYTLRSPVAGQVIAVGANLGETVDTATKLVTIVNLDTVQVQLPIPSESTAAVHAGQRVTFTADNLPGRTFEAVIKTVGKQVDAATGTLPAYCVVKNTGHVLQDDQAVKARIVTERAVGVIVPTSAVLTDPVTGEKTVALVDGTATLHIVPVKLGLEADGMTEIKSGVGNGLQVAVGGQYGIPDGAKVTVHRAQ